MESRLNFESIDHILQALETPDTQVQRDLNKFIVKNIQNPQLVLGVLEKLNASLTSNTSMSFKAMVLLNCLLKNHPQHLNNSEVMTFI